jgi:hypothetical protein
VNADGYGNRIASLIFGPKNVIVVAGMNEVVLVGESLGYQHGTARCRHLSDEPRDYASRFSNGWNIRSSNESVGREAIAPVASSPSFPRLSATRTRSARPHPG